MISIVSLARPMLTLNSYPEMFSDFPSQALCIFLRNTTESDPDDKFPYDTSGFKNLNNNSYFFFNVPVSILHPFFSLQNRSTLQPLQYESFPTLTLQDDLTHLDIVNGQCVNTTIQQDVTFGTQGLPGGINLGNKKKSTASLCFSVHGGIVGPATVAVAVVLASAAMGF